MTDHKHKLSKFLSSTVSAALLTVALSEPALAVSINNNKASEPAKALNYWDSENVYNNVAAVIFNGKGTCSGELINNRTIITAAHCFPDTSAARRAPLT